MTVRGVNICLLASAGALLLAGAGTADAALVTVGSTLPPTTGRVEFLAPATVTNTALTDPGAAVVSPVSGAVVGFGVSTAGAESGTYGIRVLRPTGDGAYTSVASIPPASITETLTYAFKPLPIRAGDAIGLDVGANSWVASGGTGTAAYAAGSRRSRTA